MGAPHARQLQSKMAHHDGGLRPAKLSKTEPPRHVAGHLRARRRAFLGQSVLTRPRPQAEVRPMSVISRRENGGEGPPIGVAIAATSTIWGGIPHCRKRSTRANREEHLLHTPRSLRRSWQASVWRSPSVSSRKGCAFRRSVPHRPVHSGLCGGPAARAAAR